MPGPLILSIVIQIGNGHACIHKFYMTACMLHQFTSIQNIDNTDVLGAAYIRGAAIDKTTMKGSRNVIVITPPVARRPGWKDDETSVFYVKCKNEAELTDVSMCM